MQTFEVNGNSFEGYLALPDSGKGIGLLLLHAWWGLNPFVLQTCDDLAQAGFVSLAPDYYNGEIANTIEEAQACRQKIDRKAVNRLVTLAIDYFSSHPAVIGPHIGAIGFSLGAGFALETTRSRNQIVKAVAVFYGTGGGKFDKVQACFMGHFAEHDPWGAHAKKVAALADRIRSTGQEAIFYTYPDTQHWFAETDRPEFQREAAELAWERTIEFFIEKLSSQSA